MEPRARSAPRRALPLVLAIAGAAFLACVIADLGPRALWVTLSSAAPAIVALTIFEALAMLCDTAAARALHGAAPRPLDDLSSGAIAYATSQLAPGAHGSGEIARALRVAARVGHARAARSALTLHAAHLVGVALAALLCACLLDDDGGGLALALVGVASWNAALATFLGVALLASPRALAWLARRSGLSIAAEPTSVLTPRACLSALAWKLSARGLHLGQAWLAARLLLARRAPSAGAAVEGLQLVAGAAADAVPAQLGVLEATFETFAAHLGDVGLAVAVALGLRLARVLWLLVLGAVALGLRCATQRAARTRLRALAAAILATSLASPHARAQADERAAPHERIDVVLRQRGVVALEPFGLEHLLSVALRLRWDDGRDPLLVGTHLEVGALAQTSPIDAIVGAYASYSPWAFLTLRAEATSISAWAIGELGEGFTPLDSADAPVRLQGDRASGVRVRAEATLALAVDLGSVRPILHAQLGRRARSARRSALPLERTSRPRPLPTCVDADEPRAPPPRVPRDTRARAPRRRVRRRPRVAGHGPHHTHPRPRAHVGDHDRRPGAGGGRDPRARGRAAR
jgi:hypothetical protein